HTRWPRDWSSDVCSSDLLEYRQDLGHLYLSRVELCLHLGKPGPALEAFRKAMALKPTSSLALYSCGTDLMNNGRLDEAIQALNQIGRASCRERGGPVAVG